MISPALVPALIAAVSGGVKALGGGIQALTSGEKGKQKELAASIEAIPDYLKSPSILNIYQQTQQRAGISPTRLASYTRQMQNIARAGATGLFNLRDARGRLGSTSSIVRSMMDAARDAEAAAESEQNRRFGQYMQATGMQAGEERMGELRKMQKQQQRISLAEARAQGAAAMKRAGLTNIFGGLTDVGKAISGDESGEFLKLFKKK